MLRLFVTFTLALLPILAVNAAQSSSTSADPAVLATVRIGVPVLAGGKPLPPGTYEVRLTNEHPTPNSGQSADAQVVVEFVAGAMVAGREVAEVLRDADLPPTGASAERVPDGARVERLKEGDFVRVSIKRSGTRYLIYLRAMG